MKTVFSVEFIKNECPLKNRSCKKLFLSGRQKTCPTASRKTIVSLLVDLSSTTILPRARGVSSCIPGNCARAPLKAGKSLLRYVKKKAFFISLKLPF